MVFSNGSFLILDWEEIFENLTAINYNIGLLRAVLVSFEVD
jgi:hypothetical protein